MAVTVTSQTVPIPTSVQQKLYSDGTNTFPAQHTDNNGGGRKKTYVSTATTTTILTGGGWVKGITVTGGTAGNLTLYDATSATGNPIWGPVFPLSGQDIPLTIRCDTGITLVTAAATTLWVLFDADAT